MSHPFDTVAEKASADLESATTSDSGAGLADVYAAQDRQRSRTRMAAAALVVVALSGGWFGRPVLTSAQVVRPDPAMTPAPQTSTAGLCRRSGVTCLGHHTYLFSLRTPVRWHVPPGFGVDSGAGVSSSQVESYWKHQGHAAGVTVLETVGAAAQDGTPLHTVDPTPEGLAHWLASRPFVTASAPVRTTLGGRAAWQVRARVKPGEPGGDFADADGGSRVGIWGGMVADYVFVDLPGRGTGLVWSWALEHDTPAVALDQVLVDGITWPAH